MQGKFNVHMSIGACISLCSADGIYNLIYVQDLCVIYDSECDCEGFSPNYDV